MDEDLLPRAKAFLPPVMELLEELSAIDTGTGQAEGIGRAGRILAGHLAELGFAITAVPAGKYGQHLLARKPGRGRSLLLLGHLDTVYPPGTARLPARTGERLTGPGVYDCKGGVAMCILAGRLWAAGGWPAAPITMLFNADEEVGSLSSRALIEAEARQARAALVVEPAPAPGKVITARRGIGRYILRVYGRAAHAGSNREAGINAVVELSAKILALERLNDGADGYTVTVGTVSGGVRPNVVPDYAQAEIDLRLSDAAVIEKAIAALEKAAAVSVVAGASCRLEGGVTRPPMPATPGNERLFTLAWEIGRDLGLDLAAASTGGGSDGNFCAAAGVPTLDGLGPAGAGAHSEEEHILWPSLAPRAALLAELGRRLGAGEE